MLLVACANVALLSLMRGLDRSDETAVRLALGASSSRLLREFLIESVLLATLGGVLGAAIAAVGLRVLPALTTDLPRLDEVALDYRSLLFIAAITALSAILSGLPQAWRRTRVVAHDGPVRAHPDGPPTALERHFLRDAIVVIQVAMAVVLMTGSGLLVRSYLHLRSTDPGFDPRGVLVAPIFLDSQAYNTGDRTRTYYRTLFERLSAIPGVIAVGGATTVPTSPLGPDFERPVWPEGTAADSLDAHAGVGPHGHARLLSRARPAPCRRARDRRSRSADIAPGHHGQRNAREAPVAGPARRSASSWSSTTARPGTYPYEVVGVVGDMRFRGPRSEPLPEIYLPHAQRSYLILNVVLKSAGDPRALIPAVRAVLKEVDPQKPAHGLVSARGSRRRHLRARSPGDGRRCWSSRERRSSWRCSASTACCRSAFASVRARSASAWPWARAARAWSAGWPRRACA